MGNTNKLTKNEVNMSAGAPAASSPAASVRTINFDGVTQIERKEGDAPAVKAWVASSDLQGSPARADLSNKLKGSAAVVASIVVIAAVALTILALTNTFNSMPGFNQLATLTQTAGSGAVIGAYAGSAVLGALALGGLWKGAAWINHARTVEAPAAQLNVAPVIANAANINTKDEDLSDVEFAVRTLSKDNQLDAATLENIAKHLGQQVVARDAKAAYAQLDCANKVKVSFGFEASKPKTA